MGKNRFDERQTTEGQIEYQLVLSLAPLGCLQDYLTANTLDFEVFCGIVKSITRGVSHLHTEIRSDNFIKPCIAHRDLSSRNILVKADRTCCISDFGFALKVFGARYEYKGEIAIAETKSINEVGTLRYMSPELLEGAVNLRDCETSLKQMDVYALSLILWETALRCADFYVSPQLIPIYKAPYEAEIGLHPTFDMMQALVVRRKARPLFPNTWLVSGATKLLRDTCEDCWDHDAEARLTSHCIEERMHEVCHLRPQHCSSSNCSIRNANNLKENRFEFLLQQKDSNNSRMQPCPTKRFTYSSAVSQPPPNRHVAGVIENLEIENIVGDFETYSTPNSCQDRNSTPSISRSNKGLLEEDKLNILKTQRDERSFSQSGVDVSTEKVLVYTDNSIEQLTENPVSISEGFLKQSNTEKILKGCHGIRELIQKNIFPTDLKKVDLASRQMSLFNSGNYSKPIEKTSKWNDAITSYIKTRKAESKEVHNELPGNALTYLNSTNSLSNARLTEQNKRPSNLSVSKLVVLEVNNKERTQREHIVAEGNYTDEARNNTIDRFQEPYPVSTSIQLNKCSSFSKITRIDLTGFAEKNKNANTTTPVKSTSQGIINPTDCELNFKRQQSLEVFREVFRSRGSTEMLRNPSQRVKTPGDVPPSVRKIRASKTLSLYDDRMMSSSTFNIL